MNVVLRAALHVHSTWSYDGRWTLAAITKAFSARHYDVVMVTEHDQGFNEERRRAHRDACQSASTDRLLLIPGIEYSDAANTVHTLVWGDVPFLGSGQETLSVLERAWERGGACVLAHPSRRAAWKVFRKEWLKYLSGIELWNRKTDGWAPSLEAGELIAETGARALVGVDFHSAKEFFPLAVHFQAAGKPEERKILEALRLGSYHCEAFGRDVQAFTGGIGGGTTRLLESNRRRAARAYRALKRWAGAVRQVPPRVLGRNKRENPAPAAVSADEP